MLDIQANRFLLCQKSYMEISSNFNQLSFHDASIEPVKRDVERIEVSFDFIRVAPEHPNTRGEVVELRNATVAYLILSLSAHYFGMMINHLLKTQTQKEGCFHLGGF